MGGVFTDAREFCAKNQVPFDTYFPVLDGRGECIYLLHYVEDLIYTEWLPQGVVEKQFIECDLRKYKEYLDYTLVEDAEVYVISEIDEYTYEIAMLLVEKYPNKLVIFNDERISYFPELEKGVRYSKLVNMQEYINARCLWITSDGKNYESNPPEFLVNIYNNINVMQSLIWCSKRECFGKKHEDYVVLIIDFRERLVGLVDYIRYAYAYYLIAKQRGWKFVIDFSHKPNQYLITESENENMWDYFFEPLSDMSLEDAYESASVIRTSVNNKSLWDNEIFPYYRFYDCIDSREAMKVIKFNRETEITIDRLMPEILKKDNRVLGVILRGTDYRPEANRAAHRFQHTASLEKVIAKCKFIMKLYDYQYVFLATEDLEYFERMKKEFGDKCLYIDQKRVYYDYKLGYKACAELLCLKNGKEFGRKYLAILQALANCKSLIVNADEGIGASWAAKGLKCSKYEYYESITP